MAVVTKINSTKVQGTKVNKKSLIQLTNELLYDIQKSIDCDHGVEVENVGSFPFALRVLNFQLMDIEDNGEPIIMVLNEDNDSVEVHNAHYGFSLLIPNKYKNLANKLSNLN